MKLYLGSWQWVTNQGAPHWAIPAGMHTALDLRPLAEQQVQGGAGGLAIFAGDTTDSDFDFLGRDDEAFDKKARSAIAKKAKIACDGATLADAIVDLLGKGDPRGEASHRPLLPTSQGTAAFFELWMGRKLKSNPFAWGDAGTSAVRDVLQADFRRAFENNAEHAKKVLGFLEQQYKFKGQEWREFVPADLRGEIDGPRKPETTITENFTRADGTTIGNLLSWTEVQDDWSTVSNQANLVTTAGVTWSSARAESDLSSADHYAQITGITMSDGFSAVGACARFAAAASTYYVCYSYANDSKLYLGKDVSGTLTNLSSAAITRSLPEAYKINISGSSLTGYQAGVSRTTSTDTAITGNTRCGIMGYQQGTSTIMDDFEASDSISAGILYTQLERSTRGITRGLWTGGF